MRSITQSSPSRAVRALVRSNAQLVWPLVLSVVAFASLEPQFLLPANLLNILAGTAFVGVIAVGQTIVVLSGELDLSVGATASLAAVVGATLMVDHGVPAVVGVLAVLGVGVLVGVVNSVLSGPLRIPSFIATIAMLYVVRGLATFITSGQPVGPVPDVVQGFGSSALLGLSVPFLVFAVVVVAGEFGTRYTVPGRWLYAVGDDEEVARLVGINARGVKTAAFIICGVTAALAGLLQMASLATATDSIGIGWELIAVAAVVIGGTSIFGGEGTVVGTALGMLLLTTVTNGLVTVGVESNWQTLAVGAIMILAIASDFIRKRARGDSTVAGATA